MAYISSFERLSREEGFKQGLQQGECYFLLRLLERKFKIIPEKYHQQILAADAETLLIWGERILSANMLEEIFI